MSIVDGWWRIVAASVAGDGHLGRGGGCEDATRTAVLPDGTAIVAVADGVSTAPCGAAGAAVAVDVARVLLVERLADSDEHPATAREWHELLDEVFGEVNGRLAAMAALAFPDAPDAPRRFRTTLAAVVLTDDWCVAGLVGDALVGVRRGDGSLHAVIPPTDGSTAIDAPDTLPRLDGALRVRAVVIRERLASVFVATDGMAAGLLESAPGGGVLPRGALGTALFDLVGGGGGSHDLAEILLGHTGLRARTNDDRTLVVVTRDPDARPGTA